MSNIFTDLVAKLTRRQKKNRPIAVPPKPAPEKPPVVVTYNRVDGVPSGGVLGSAGSRGVVWDDTAKVYRGRNHVVQAAPPLQQKRKRYDDDDNDFEMYVVSTPFDDAFFYQSEETPPERGYGDTNNASGYDGYTQSVPESYGGSEASYSTPDTSYSASTSYGSSSDSGSSSYSGGSSYSSSDSGGSSYSSSDSGGSYSSD